MEHFLAHPEIVYDMRQTTLMATAKIAVDSRNETDLFPTLQNAHWRNLVKGKPEQRSTWFFKASQVAPPAFSHASQRKRGNSYSFYTRKEGFATCTTSALGEPFAEVAILTDGICVGTCAQAVAYIRRFYPNVTLIATGGATPFLLSPWSSDRSGLAAYDLPASAVSAGGEAERYSRIQHWLFKLGVNAPELPPALPQNAELFIVMDEVYLNSNRSSPLEFESIYAHKRIPSFSRSRSYQDLFNDVIKELKWQRPLPPRRKPADPRVIAGLSVIFGLFLVFSVAIFIVYWKSQSKTPTYISLESF